MIYIQRIQLRRDIAANWVSHDPILAQGEVGLELDSHSLKIGDGSTAWTSLLYGPALGVLINQAAPKTTPIDADMFALMDSAASNVLTKFSWANLKTMLGGIYVIANAAIVGATKTKITYDAKGLITSGADATTADIADSANARYCTDAQKTVIGNTSGTNSGDNAANSSTMYIGTTAVALNRASANLALTGITGITPTVDFTLTQNGVVPFTSVEVGAIVNTLYLKAGKVGVGTATPGFLLEAAGIISAGTGASGGFRNSTYSAGQNLIWAFGNAPAYGISYKQGSGSDDIRFHFGDYAVPSFVIDASGRIATGGITTLIAEATISKAQHAPTVLLISNPDTTTSDFATQASIRMEVNGTLIGGFKCTARNLTGLTTSALYCTTEGNYPIAFGINASPAPTISIHGGLSIGSSYIDIDPGNGGIIVQSGISIGRSTLGASKLSVVGLPISVAGLTTGDIWVDTTGGLNILKIV